jgi:hypothetical protein
LLIQVKKHEENIQQYSPAQIATVAEHSSMHFYLNWTKRESTRWTPHWRHWAEARSRKLKEAGSESWSALSAALAESRKAFDRANQQAWDAFKRAAPLIG